MIAKPPFTLPDAPVDRYTVEWFRVCYDSGQLPWIEHRSAIYYTDARYEDVVPGEHGGVPLTDQWMVSSNGHHTGRWCGDSQRSGWEAPFAAQRARHLPAYWTDCYATVDEARARAVEICRELIAHFEQRAAEVREAMARFVKQSLESASVRGKSASRRTGAPVPGGAGVEKFSATSSPVATPASAESGTSRSSCRAEVPEARPRKGERKTVKP